MIAIYQAPGANALSALGAVKDAMAAAKANFPEDLEWKVTYDPTTFVTDTIHEVEKTLVEAFVLVVLVVFLFLGNLRATLIPTIAVPVSLIGTFIVLNAIGYSANTVSLLAVVLAIGIVVDDAIVVVEAVEQVMEQQPELSLAGHQGRDGTDLRADHRHHAGAAVGVRSGGLHPRHFGRTVPPIAVTVAVSMFLSAINALTLSPALCAILLHPHHGPRRGPIGAMMRAIDWVRDRYGAIVARLVRISIIGLVMVVASMAGVWGLGKVTPTGFLPEDDQGAFFVIVQLPDGASVARTTEFVSQVEAVLKQQHAVADYSATIGLNFIDNYSQPNAAFLIVSLKPFEERTGARDRSGADCRLGPKFRRYAAEGRCHSRRRRLSASAPAAASPTSCRTPAAATAGARRCAARPAGGGQSGTKTATCVQHLLRQHTIHLSRHRSRQGTDPQGGPGSNHPGPAGLAWRLLRQ